MFIFLMKKTLFVNQYALNVKFPSLFVGQLNEIPYGLLMHCQNTLVLFQTVVSQNVQLLTMKTDLTYYYVIVPQLRPIGKTTSGTLKSWLWLINSSVQEGNKFKSVTLPRYICLG